MFSRVSIVVAGLMFFGSTPAWADDRPYPTANMLELGLFSGAFVPSQSHELYDSTQSFQSRLDPLGLTLSLRAAYFPLAWLGAEVEGGFMPQNNDLGQRVNMFSARGHGVVQLPWRVTPFALFGAGYLGASTDETGSDIDPAMHWGAGLKYFPTSWMSLRVDGRQIWTAREGPGEGNTSHFEVLAGISFTLWRADEDDLEPPPVIFVEKTEEPEPVREAAPEVVEASQDLVVMTPAQQIADELARVHFPWASSRLGPATYPALDLAADLLQRNPELRVEIAGHADATGSKRYNLRLSRRRADAVRAYLVAAGVDADRLLPVAFGEQRPAATNRHQRGRALNRRCEIRVLDAHGDEVASRD